MELVLFSTFTQVRRTEQGFQAYVASVFTCVAILLAPEKKFKHFHCEVRKGQV